TQGPVMSPVWINAYRHGSVAATLAELQSTDLSLVEDARSLAGHDYGPITPLLNDDSISEVMVNGPGQVYIERNGQLIQAGVAFAGEEELVRVIREIAAFVGRRVGEQPLVVARRPRGPRGAPAIPPLLALG